MADEYVTSPDQRKPENLKVWRAVWIVVAIVTALMLFGNHTGRLEDIFLAVISVGIIAWLILDAWMRKRGWK